MKEAAITKIATEALKPVSSFLDALLGPKIQRVKFWSEKRELSSRLGSGAIDVLLDQYFRRLLRRICGITTIVFPQQVLPLTSIYEPLTLRVRYDRAGSRQPPRFSVKTLAKGHNYFIVDSAGMGKSTFAKHFVLEILDSTEKIPLFLELRRIGEDESLLGRLSLEIDGTKTEVDESLLLLLLDEGDFVLILDGFDEIAEQSRERLAQQITQLAVQCENLQVIVTARPEVSLPEIPDSKVLAVEPLTKKQAESLILRYDRVAGISVGSNLLAHFDSVDQRFLETPLLVILLYRTYGFNQSIATKITTFYDEVFNALYKGHDLSKAGFARAKSSSLDSEDFRRLLRGFSFILATRQKDNLKSRTEAIKIIDEAVRLTSVRPSSPSAFLDDLLLAVPLLVQEGTDYRFIHRSIGEFFAAEFLAYQPKTEQIIERIRDGSLNPSFLNTFQYLSEINPSIFRRTLVAPLARSILDSPLRNPHVLTLRFLGGANIGLWPNNKYTREEGAGPVSASLPLTDNHNCYSTMPGRVGGDKYTLAVSFSRDTLPKLPAAAWEAVSEMVFMEPVRSDTVNNFDRFLHVLSEEQWLSVDDERVLQIAEDPMITFLFNGSINFAISRMSGMDRWGADPPTRILSFNACNTVLEQIRQEEETQGWLETLVAGERGGDMLS